MAGRSIWPDPASFPMSPVSEFTTKGDSYRNQVVYVAYKLAR